MAIFPKMSLFLIGQNDPNESQPESKDAKGVFYIYWI
jgi:hypothetical protein